MTKAPRGDDGEIDDRESPQPASISAAEAAGIAVRDLVELTTREVVGVTSVAPTDDGWLIEVEVVEDRRIPTSSDILALYEVELTLDGDLISYSRTQRYARGSSDVGRKSQ
ncbi:gas vesicle protein [Rhodococcus maanshanensis]|uniref:Gas vesicle synthesis protein GvpO n=1 Tax=Rhodococcus maanshanensis TaxID=183556 RepID=A0A1H7LS04_9NOCA|nr:gas vesicle protein [Rhodococcus maanshanensis]SEL01498.1 Gas vesicle synthesis protein GvpO [Rhodococcus maanshanensis]